MTKIKQDSHTVNASYRRLRRTYWIAVVIIASSILLSFFLLNRAFLKQKDDAAIINIAGRQRMLSQKLTKEIYLISQGNSKYIGNLETSTSLWVDSHRYLKDGPEGKENIAAVQGLFQELEPHFLFLQETSDLVIKGNALDQEKITQLLSESELFLTTMDAIVSEYEKESQNKLRDLERIEFYLSLLGILVLLGEVLFLFWPTSKVMKNSIIQLQESADAYREKAQQNEELLRKTEQNYKELQLLYYAIDQTTLFASLNLHGDLLYLSDKFSKLINRQGEYRGKRFYEWITEKESEQEYIETVLMMPRSEMWVGEVPITQSSGDKVWLEMSIIPINRDGLKQSRLVLCNDLTLRKEAQLRVEQLIDEKYQSKMVEQNEIASQVVIGQEEERKRIAKDIHDGIGQMLTALKFNVESLNPSEYNQEEEKIKTIKKLSSELIKGVRMATFNLTPPELSDYGIVTGLRKLAEGLTGLSGQDIILINKSDFDQRFDFNVEINVYRIVQEAVNNAIKYGKADSILVTIFHKEKLLSITVDDNGRGFDMNKFHNPSKRKDGSGMGFSFMKERAKYINAKFYVQSEIDAGTKVTINLPLK